MPPCRFQQCLALIKTLTAEGCFFFFKILKIFIDFNNAINIPQNVFGFLDKWIWTGCQNFSLLWREYLWSAVSVLANGPKIADLILERSFPTQYILDWWKSKRKMLLCRFQRCLYRLIRWLTKRALKQDLSCIQVITFFGVNNFGNTQAMRLSFTSKWSKFYLDFKSTIRIREKVFGFWDNRIWTGCMNFSLL